jgi:hypothetical protein
MRQPAWYGPVEARLETVRPLLVLALGALAVTSAYLAWQAAHGRHIVPAAAWTTYMFMP